MLTILRRYPGILFNLFFLAFFAILEPAVLARLLEVIDNGARDPLLGVIFLSAPFLELAGFYLAAPALIDRLAQAPPQPGTLPGLVWMAHLVITLVLLLNGFACFQLDTTNGPPPQGSWYWRQRLLKRYGIDSIGSIERIPSILSSGRASTSSEHAR